MQDSEALRKAVEEIQPENVKIGLRLAQSKPLYQVLAMCVSGRAGGSRAGIPASRTSIRPPHTRRHTYKREPYGLSVFGSIP